MIRVHTAVVYTHWVTLYNVFPTVGHEQRGLKTFIFFDGKGDWGIHAVVEATTRSVDSRLACSALGRLGRIGSCNLPLGQPHSSKAWGNPAHARAKH